MVSARKEFDDKKKALADAFARKARALSEVEEILGKPCYTGKRLVPSSIELIVCFEEVSFPGLSSQAHTRRAIFTQLHLS